MPNLNIRTKLIITGMVIGTLFLSVITTIVLEQNQRMITVGKEESLRLAYGDLKHIVENLYSLAESHQEVTQKNIVSALKVAHRLVEQSGDINFSKETAQWNAINQYTKTAISIDLPKMNMGNVWFGQISSPEMFSPLVDPIRDTLDVTCTVFQRMNQAGDMLRIATNVSKKDGSRAIGTYIPAINPDGKLNPVIETILRGEIFKGRAYVVNNWYITAYEPIFDESRNVVGVLYVGIPQENVKSLRKAITGTKIGTSGFVTVMDSSGAYVISHENDSGESDVVTSKNKKGKSVIKERVEIAKNLSPREIGKQQYTFNGSSKEAILRDARFVYFEPWDWVITAEADEGDFTRASVLIENIGSRGNIFIGIVSTVLLVIFIVILCFVSNSITRPIKGLVKVFEEYGRGNTKIRAEASSKDEIGYFSTGFNTMLDKIDAGARTIKESEFAYRKLFNQLQDAIETNSYDFRFANDVKRVELIGSLNQMLETLENADRETTNQNWLKTGEADLNSIISNERNLVVLCQKSLLFIAKYVDAQVGTFFVKSVEDDTYSMIANYAFKERKGLNTTFKAGEGIAGQAVFEKETILFSDVPEDYIRVESSLGYTVPSYILAIPLIYEKDVKGVMELGTVRNLSKLEVEFVELASKILAVAMNTAMFNERLELLLGQTREQAQELEEQQEELKAANEELEEHTQILKKSEAKLQLQQEELQASNEELEEKTEILEQQKGEIAGQNETLQKKQIDIEEKAKQLELATKYKSEFLANMSHELRTPLNSLLILANLLSENEENNLTADQVESATAIYKGGKSLLRLINDILDLSKIEARKIELSVGPTLISSISDNCHAEFTHMAKDKGLELQIQTASNFPKTITTDKHRLIQIARNLLGNAIKFTEKGSVSVSFVRPGPRTVFKHAPLNIDSTIAIVVTDTGIGISEEKMALIFEAFTQADGSISRRHGGTGLGLSISKELATLLGGELVATSRLNEGTTFTLYLPEVFTPQEITQETEDLAGPIKTTTPTVSVTTKAEEDVDKVAEFAKPAVVQSETKLHSVKTMLIIEDDKSFATLLASFFNKHGYESIIAPDGETGIKSIIEHQPTAVVLDIGLPGIDGWAVLNELKNNPATRHIPVHILSAFDDTRHGLERGAVGYLMKPVDNNDLQEVLSKIESVLQGDVKKLLIVEDDDDLRNNLLTVMQTKDIQTETAKTGQDALTLLENNHFDCMILDLGLPDISGFEVLDTLQQNPELVKVPVIIYTGRDLAQEEIKKLDQYASSIVLKSAASIERLLDETALFMHRVEADIPEEQRKMIQGIRDRESVLPGKTVLVVDDDMRNAMALNKFLKSKGMEVIIADNGQRALDVLNDEENNGSIDIVLMDIMMPVMDGYEAMRFIRDQPRFKSLPILALTAKAMDSDRQDCIDAGANDYMAKPVDTSKLLTMLRVWLYSG